MRTIVAIGGGVFLGVVLGYLLKANDVRKAGDDRGMVAGPSGVSDLQGRPGKPGQIERPGDRPTAPRFAQISAKGVEGDPLTSFYDPVDLVTIGNNMRDVFRSEPRSLPWAAEMERIVGSSVTVDVKHFSDRAEVRQTECRTSCCRVDVDVPNEELKRISLALQIVVRGDLGEIDNPDVSVQEGWHRQSLYTCVRPERRDLGVYIDWLRQWRKKQLHYLRAHPEAFAAWNIGHVEVPPD